MEPGTWNQGCLGVEQLTAHADSTLHCKLLPESSADRMHAYACSSCVLHMVTYLKAALLLAFCLIISLLRVSSLVFVWLPQTNKTCAAHVCQWFCIDLARSASINSPLKVLPAILIPACGGIYMRFREYKDDAVVLTS